MLPLSDAPNDGRFPLVTYALIAANVIVFLVITVPLSGVRPAPTDPRLPAYVAVLREALPRGASLEQALRQVSSYDLFVFEHGYKPAAPEVSDLLSAMFLHGGFMHLFGNMLFLWIYGDNVEHRLGRLRFLLWYLLTGVAATLFFALFSPASMVPMVGASGAISGVLGFYFVWFPHNVVRVLLLFFPFLVRIVEIPARIVLGLYLVVDNLLPLLVVPSGGGGVAYGAHIGGFLAGMLAAWAMNAREVRAVPAEYRAARAPFPSPSSVIGEALRAGDFERAARAYFALSPSDAASALSPAQSLALARWLADNGHPEAALTVFQRHLVRYPRGPEAAEAHLGAGLVELQHLGRPAFAYRHFLEALRAAPDEDTAARARAGLDAIAARQKFAMRRFAR